MKIVTTSNLGLTILLSCTLGMGIVGWYGSQRLADLLSYVLGAAWQTADGAMEGSIELGNQSLYIQKMLRGMPLDEPELQRARAATADAMRRVGEGRLIDATAIGTMEQQHLAYQQQQEQLLALYRAFTSVDQALRALKKKLQRTGVFRAMKLKQHFEKTSVKKARERAEAVRRARKLARKKLQREGAL